MTTNATSPSHRRPGRPKKRLRDRRSEWIGAAVTQGEKRDFEARATKAGLSATEYLRWCVGFPEIPST